jgi:hypothetical protein
MPDERIGLFAESGKHSRPDHAELVKQPKSSSGPRTSCNDRGRFEIGAAIHSPV